MSAYPTSCNETNNGIREGPEPNPRWSLLLPQLPPPDSSSAVPQVTRADDRMLPFLVPRVVRDAFLTNVYRLGVGSASPTRTRTCSLEETSQATTIAALLLVVRSSPRRQFREKLTAIGTTDTVTSPPGHPSLQLTPPIQRIHGTGLNTNKCALKERTPPQGLALVRTGRYSLCCRTGEAGVTASFLVLLAR